MSFKSKNLQKSHKTNLFLWIVNFNLYKNTVFTIYNENIPSLPQVKVRVVPLSHRRSKGPSDFCEPNGRLSHFSCRWSSSSFPKQNQDEWRLRERKQYHFRQVLVWLLKCTWKLVTVNTPFQDPTIRFTSIQDSTKYSLYHAKFSRNHVKIYFQYKGKLSWKVRAFSRTLSQLRTKSRRFNSTCETSSLSAQRQKTFTWPCKAFTNPETPKCEFPRFDSHIRISVARANFRRMIGLPKNWPTKTYMEGPKHTKISKGIRVETMNRTNHNWVQYFLLLWIAFQDYETGTGTLLLCQTELLRNKGGP